MPEFQDLLTSRRTIYRFSDKKVDTETLELAFDAARKAPCHKNTHPWKFYIMGKEARKEIIPEVKRLAKKKVRDGEDEGAGISKAVDKILSPPVLICVTSALSPQDPFREEEDYAATVCSTHNLVLSLWGMASDPSGALVPLLVQRHRMMQSALLLMKRGSLVSSRLAIPQEGFHLRTRRV